MCDMSCAFSEPEGGGERLLEGWLPLSKMKKSMSLYQNIIAELAFIISSISYNYNFLQVCISKMIVHR